MRRFEDLLDDWAFGLNAFINGGRQISKFWSRLNDHLAQVMDV